MNQPSFYNSLPVCSIMTFRTYLKENRQEEGWPTLALTPSVIGVLVKLYVGKFSWEEKGVLIRELSIRSG